MIELMGDSLPPRLKFESEFSQEFFDRHGNLKHIKKLKYRDLRDVLDETYRDGDELDTLAAFLEPMLKLDDKERACAKTMMNHIWLNV